MPGRREPGDPVVLNFRERSGDGDPEVLYHYCSTEAFFAIISFRTIRLSALTMSNDSEEGRLVLHLIDQLGQQRKTSPGVLKLLKEHFNEVTAANEGLGFCLSERGDLLSQWRGYADQGRGICIGFSVPYLQAISGPSDLAGALSLVPVEYDEIVQLHRFKRTFDSMVGIVQASMADDLAADHSLGPVTRALVASKANNWAKRLYTFKGEGFSEEAEWRMLALLDDHPDADSQFRPAGDKIVAYRDVRLENPGAGPIVSVTLGSKHVTPINQVERFVRRHGFQATVRKSRLTYR